MIKEIVVSVLIEGEMNTHTAKYKDITIGNDILMHDKCDGYNELWYISAQNYLETLGYTNVETFKVIKQITE
tara:strand:+ start:261 stop:476 length:216 start_codon:yes stop_codon:yes gene_type:complete